MATLRHVKCSLVVALVMLLNASTGLANLPFVGRQATPAPPPCPLNNFCFVYDHSSSINPTEFQLEVDFILEIARAVDMIATSVTYSAAAFASSAQLVQASTSDLEGTFVPAITSFPQIGGGTDIGLGMRICLDEIVNSTGTRAMIVLTDGQDGGSTALAVANEARNESVAVTTIGIIPGADIPFLKSLATTPDFFSEAVFSMLPSIVDSVVNATCTLANMFSCQVDDVCFAIDSSSSIDAGEFGLQQAFVEEIATILDSRNSSTMFSAHTFADDVMPILPIGTMNSLGDFIPVLNSLTTGVGSTNAFAGLRSCFEDLNNRTGNRVIVFVTDGRDNSNPRALAGRRAVVDSGIGILSVGIGSNVNLGYLDRLSTVPGSVVSASSFSTLSTSIDTVANQVCSMASTATPPADACEEQFQGCLLTFRRSRTLSTFRLRGGRRRFTPFISSKFGFQAPGTVRRITSFAINDDGTMMRLRGPSFTLDSNRSPYGVTLNVDRLSEGERFGGKCIRMDLRMRRGAGTVDQCVVFRTMRI